MAPLDSIVNRHPPLTPGTGLHLNLEWIHTHHRTLERSPLISTAYAIMALVYKLRIYCQGEGETTEKLNFITDHHLAAIHSRSVGQLFLIAIPIIGTLAALIIHRREDAAQRAPTVVTAAPVRTPEEILNATKAFIKLLNEEGPIVPEKTRVIDPRNHQKEATTLLNKFITQSLTLAQEGSDVPSRAIPEGTDVETFNAGLQLLKIANTSLTQKPALMAVAFMLLYTSLRVTTVFPENNILVELNGQKKSCLQFLQGIAMETLDYSLLYLPLKNQHLGIPEIKRFIQTTFTPN